MRRMFAIMLCLALLLAGCGESDEAYVPTGDGLTWDADYTGPIPTAASREDEEEEMELVLTYYPSKTMNPISSTDFTNRALFSLIYQGLFCVDRSYNVEPLLCRTYNVSDDLCTYTFYLERATFSDGSFLTGEDVVASLNAARESDYYGGRFTYVNEIYVAEDGGVVISLFTPYENLPLLLDIPIISKDALEDDRPLGTGPYVFNGTALGGTLRKRTNWWCESDLVITQDTIRLVAAESITHIRDEFEFGDLSLVCANPGSGKYVDYRCDYELWDCDNGVFVYLAFCDESYVFSVPELRVNLTHAIDRDTLVSTYYRGFARSAQLPASPLFPYYSQALAANYGYNPGKFTAALQDAGLDGASIVLLVNSDDSLRMRVARHIGQMLNDCGLAVTMKEVSGQAYRDALILREYDLLVGQTKLSANMDLSEFFDTTGSLSYGGMDDLSVFELCRLALENHGNYYSLHKTVMDNGLLCPVITGSYAVYATRGLLTDLSPARDNIFSYSIGKTMADALVW